MPWLRVGRVGRWKGKSPDDAAHVADAALDLFNPARPDPPSVFRVEDEAEARAVAAEWAVTHRDPGPVDVVLLPDAFLEATPPSAAPRKHLTPLLSERHFVIDGMNAPRAEELARATLGTAPVALRVSEREIRAAIAPRASDEALQPRLTPRWASVLLPPR